MLQLNNVHERHLLVWKITLFTELKQKKLRQSLKPDKVKYKNIFSF